MKFFRSSSNQAAGPAAPQKLTRRSSGMGEISRLLNSQEGLCVLDLGSTSANNIRFLTGKGHKNYSEDLLRSSLDPALRMQDSTGNSVIDSKKFLDENLVYVNAQFDVVLCWNLPDYMEESLVKPTIDRLWSVMKPGGFLLAFFHTRDAGPDSTCYRSVSYTHLEQFGGMLLGFERLAEDRIAAAVLLFHSACSFFHIIEGLRLDRSGVGDDAVRGRIDLHDRAAAGAGHVKTGIVQMGFAFRHRR